MNTEKSTFMVFESRNRLDGSLLSKFKLELNVIIGLLEEVTPQSTLA